jgi:hypothetical protein
MTRAFLPIVFLSVACAGSKGDAELETLRANVGTAKDLATQVDAHARLGAALWQRACVHPAADGSCTSPGTPEPPVKGIQTRCGPASKNVDVVAARDASLVAQAHDELQQAVHLWNNGEALKSLETIADENDRRAKTYVMVGGAASALLTLADAEYEAYLAIGIDKNLTYDTPEASERSKKAFTGWIDKKTAALKQATETYKTLAESEPIRQYSGDRAIAGMARAAQMLQHLSDTLFTLSIPAELRKDQDAVDVYCDALGSKAAPLEEQAIEVYRACVATARDLKVTGEWPELCRHQFSLIKPSEEP